MKKMFNRRAALGWACFAAGVYVGRNWNFSVTWTSNKPNV